jgi:glycerol-3-phosphate dehydrogenase
MGASAPQPAALSPGRRRRDLAALADANLDVLVVGGGVVGAGAALDAASRGLSVGLIEARDFASGTSSVSSKLIHGGLRYLQRLDLGLVREALRERAILLRTTHLVQPIELLYPLRRRIERPYVGAGLALYDLLARLPGGEDTLPRTRFLNAPAARAAVPGFRPERLVGAARFFDAQVDDARLVIELVRAAATYGAHVCSGARLVRLEAEAHGEVATIRLEAEREITVRARSVVVATGVWSDEVARAAGVVGPPLRPSKGVHLVVARDRIETDRALIIPTKQSVLFVLPWGAHWIVGTTDTAWSGDPDMLSASAEDIDFLLAEIKAELRTPLVRGDIESVYVGLRPLIARGSGATASLSREHEVEVARRGLVFIAGGKLTTYRVMAKDAVDAALRSAGITAPASTTEDIALPGRESDSEISELSGAHPALARRYGGLIAEVLQSDRALEAIAGAPGYVRGEFEYAATHEGARHLSDVLERRTRLSIETADRGTFAAGAVAAILAPVLSWSPEEVRSEIEGYEAGVAKAQATENIAQVAS